MAIHSKIEWTEHTFNPWWGCVKVSPACDHCYAETFAKRIGFSDSEKASRFPIWGKDTPRRFFSDSHWAEPLKWNREAEKAGKRQRVFCGSMCDVMEERADLQPHRERLYELIERTPHLDWLLLTKRPQNFRRFLPQAWLDNPRPNVWGMTTVEGPDYLWRAKELAKTPFVARGLSVEPLLAPIDLLPVLGDGPGQGIHWVIVGGESGPGARDFDVQWARDIVEQCKTTGAACFIKQLGARPRVVTATSEQLKLRDKKGGDMSEWPTDLRVRDVPVVLHGTV